MIGNIKMSTCGRATMSGTLTNVGTISNGRAEKHVPTNADNQWKQRVCTMND